MKHRMRCSKGRDGCAARFNLRKHPSKYKRSIKCPHCGSTKVFSVEKNRQDEMKARKEKGNLCYCGAYPFPHDLGGLRACTHHPLNVKGVPMDEIEQAEYIDCLKTKRGNCQ